MAYRNERLLVQISLAIATILLLGCTFVIATTAFSMNMQVANVHSKRNGNTRNQRPKRRKKSGNRNLSANQNQNLKLKKKKQLKKIYTMEEISQMTIAQAVVESTSSQQLLNTATRLWLPTDDDLLPHFRTQIVHHEKRMKAASQLLKRLGDCIGQERGVRFDAELWNVNGEAGENGYGLKRAILASSIPFQGEGNVHENYAEKEMKNICMALSGVHVIVGFTLPRSHSSSSSTGIMMDPAILEELRSLIQRADTMASDMSMSEAVELRWSIRGILSRIGSPLSDLLLREQQPNHEGLGLGLDGLTMALCIPQLEKRVAKLPFDILPSCLDWEELNFDPDSAAESNAGAGHGAESDAGADADADADANGSTRSSIMKRLLSDIPFNFDTITTRTGSKVVERRGTAWIGEEGIGSLAYSGKLMNPHPIPSIVSQAMRQVEQSILANNLHLHGNGNGYDDYVSSYEQLDLCSQEFGGYFDCALCNHYPDEDASCKFHTDPEHGTYWERLTCVVSAGDEDVRKFAFRPIPDLNNWNKYDDHDNIKEDEYKESMITPAVITLFPGDVVKMDTECNDVFHHAVYGRNDAAGMSGSSSFNSAHPSSTQNANAHAERTNGSHGRVSLVFKRAMDRGDGRKGHGKAGQGRRGRARRF